jgi:mono/diheme cytochrome c family protein
VDTIGRQVTAFVTMFMLAGLIILMYMIFEPQRRAAAYNEQIETASERGAHLFAENCVVCHGVQGQGIQGAGFALNTEGNKAPDDDRRAFLRNTIDVGRQNSNGWEPNMPAFLNSNGGPLNSQQVEDLVTFIGCGDWDEVGHYLSGELGTPINAIPTPPNLGTPNARIIPGAVTTPAAGAGGATAMDPGAAVFQGHCITCHKITPDFPSGGTTGPDLTGVAIRKIPSRSQIIPNQIDVPTEGAAGLTRWIRDPASVRSGTGMPPFGTDKISDQEMAALTAWLMTHTTPPAAVPEKSCFQTVGR